MKKSLIISILLLAGCTTTGQAYLPHTSRVFHAKKSCAGCTDPSPIVFQSTQDALNVSGISPCSLCVKVQNVQHQGYTQKNYSASNPVAANSANNYSPIICTTTLRLLGRLSKSITTICCHVPSRSLPLSKGTVKEEPSMAARTWA